MPAMSIWKRVSAALASIVAIMLFAAPVGAANLTVKMSCGTGTSSVLEASYSGSLGPVSASAMASTSGRAQLKLSVDHSFDGPWGYGGKLTVAATGARAERAWHQKAESGDDDWLHLHGGFDLKAPSSAPLRPKLAVDVDVRRYPFDQARDYMQAAASGSLALPPWAVEAVGALSGGSSFEAGGKLMPYNPKWTSVFGSAGLDLRWRRPGLDIDFGLSLRGRAYPESLAKSYMNGQVGLALSPGLEGGHKLQLTVSGAGRSRPLSPELSTIGGKVGAKWSYTPPRGSASFRPTLSASASGSVTVWHNDPEGRRSTGVSLNAGASVPVAGGVTLKGEAAWRSSGQVSEAEEGEGDEEASSGVGLTLTASASWSRKSAPSPTVSITVKAASSGEGWKLSAVASVGCKF